MKAKLLLTSLFALSVQQTVLAQTDANGYTTVNMSMGANYQNRVFFDFNTNNIVSQPANSWDIAFYRASVTNFGTRINDAHDIKVYQASANPADWNTITTNSVASYGAPLLILTILQQSRKELLNRVLPPMDGEITILQTIM